MANDLQRLSDYKRDLHNLQDELELKQAAISSLNTRISTLEGQVESQRRELSLEKSWKRRQDKIDVKVEGKTKLSPSRATKKATTTKSKEGGSSTRENRAAKPQLPAEGHARAGQGRGARTRERGRGRQGQGQGGSPFNRDY